MIDDGANRHSDIVEAQPRYLAADAFEARARLERERQLRQRIELRLQRGTARIERKQQRMSGFHAHLPRREECCKPCASAEQRYSWCKTAFGSVRAARRAGTMQAATPAASIASSTPT